MTNKDHLTLSERCSHVDESSQNYTGFLVPVSQTGQIALAPSDQHRSRGQILKRTSANTSQPMEPTSCSTMSTTHARSDRSSTGRDHKLTYPHTPMPMTPTLRLVPRRAGPLERFVVRIVQTGRYQCSVCDEAHDHPSLHLGVLCSLGSWRLLSTLAAPLLFESHPTKPESSSPTQSIESQRTRSGTSATCATNRHQTRQSFSVLEISEIPL